jgi:hypothetical protein
VTYQRRRAQESQSPQIVPAQFPIPAGKAFIPV